MAIQTHFNSAPFIFIELYSLEKIIHIFTYFYVDNLHDYYHHLHHEFIYCLQDTNRCRKKLEM